ncbi:MAG: transketolase C-terminal domain-containing protein [Candidatus Bathyarchaeia archaeon]
MTIKDVLTGNAAAAYGAKLARAEVIAAYPITPQTSVVEKIADFIHRGELRAEYIKVESEHSAMAACIGASIGGARTFTATSSQGLLLMNEMVFWAGYGRCPIVMVVVTRGIAPPWSIWSDHTDALAQRDTGWIQLFCYNNQEILDTIIEAYKIAEDKRVLLPLMVCYDALEISHTAEVVSIPAIEEVDGFLPPYQCSLLDTKNPILLWNGAFPRDAIVLRYILADAMKKAKAVMKEVDEEFGKTFGRQYGLVEFYKCDNADAVIVAMGSVAGTAKSAVDALNEEGYRIGLARIRSFRPFPKEELRGLATKIKALLVLDRDMSFGQGILCTEVKAALYDLKRRPFIYGFIAGLAGEVVSRNEIMETSKAVVHAAEKGIMQREIEWFKPRIGGG